jgi:hypothetical protein
MPGGQGLGHMRCMKNCKGENKINLDNGDSIKIKTATEKKPNKKKRQREKLESFKKYMQVNKGQNSSQRCLKNSSEEKMIPSVC